MFVIWYSQQVVMTSAGLRPAYTAMEGLFDGIVNFTIIISKFLAPIIVEAEENNLSVTFIFQQKIESIVKSC